MNIKANAKINLSLDIIGRDERGYHKLRMVMQSISLCDDIELNISDEAGIRLTVQDERAQGCVTENTAGNVFIPADRQNLMYRAAEALMEDCNLNAGIDMKLIKRIPSEAGLGGGSADAAAVLKGMNELFALGLGDEKLREIGLKLGADIPFCIMGGTALAEGIGEKLTSLDNRCRLYVLLIKPRLGMSTPKVYAAYDELTGMYGKGIISAQPEHADTEGLVKALAKGDCTSVFKKIKNVLEEPVIRKIPLVEQIKADLISLGAGAAAMTGSGSVVYGLFTDEDKMQLAEEYICKCDYLNEISEIIKSEFI